MSVDLGMPPVGPPMKAQDHEFWTLNPGSACLPYECTLKGIQTRCGGGCCLNRGFGPPSWGTEKWGDPCTRLEPGVGCTLGEGRPVVCHLYPLVITDDRGTMMVHHVTRWPHGGACKGNRKAEGAPMLIDAIREGLVAVFGEAEVDAARHRLVVEGKPYRFRVPAWVKEALDNEARWEAEGVPPTAR